MAQLPRPNFPSEVALYQKLKDFIKDFKIENQRLPSNKEIQTGAKADYSSVIKYLDEGKDFLTRKESSKLKDYREKLDLTKAEKKWYKIYMV